MALDFLNPVAAGPVADDEITVAHDCGSGADRWLLVAVPVFSAGETPTVAGVTYDGTALSAAVQGSHLYAGNTNVVRAEWWFLDLAAAGKTGSNNVVVTLSGAADQLSVIAVTATGCGGLGANTNTTGGNLSVVSAAITTAAATSRVLGVWSGATDRAVTPGTDNTLIEDVTGAAAPPNNLLAWAGWEPATGGSDTWDITLSSAVRSSGAVLEVVEATGGGGTTHEAEASDGLALGETSARSKRMSATATDGLALGSSQARRADFAGSGGDGLLLGDAGSATAQLVGTAADGLTLGEALSVAALLAALAADGIQFGESALGDLAGALEAAAMDGLVFGESPSAAARLVAQAADTLHIGETLAALAALLAAAADGLALADAGAGSIGAAVVEAAAADGLAFGDAASVAAVIDAIVQDGLVFGEDGQVRARFIVHTVDGLAFGAALQAAMALAAIATDGLVLGDVTALIEAVGVVTVTFTVKQGRVSFTVKQPGASFEARQPGASFSTGE